MNLNYGKDGNINSDFENNFRANDPNWRSKPFGAGKEAKSNPKTLPAGWQGVAEKYG